MSVQTETITVEFPVAMRALEKLATLADSRGKTVSAVVKEAIEHELQANGLTLYDYRIKPRQPLHDPDLARISLNLSLTPREYDDFCRAQQNGHDYSISDYIARRFDQPVQRKQFKSAWRDYMSAERERLQGGARRTRCVALTFDVKRLGRYRRLAEQYTGGNLSHLFRTLLYWPEDSTV